MSEKVGFWRWLWNNTKLLPKQAIPFLRVFKEDVIFEYIVGLMLVIFSLAFTLTASWTLIIGVVLGILLLLHCQYRGGLN